jgi:hypothetical protein
MRRDSRQMRAFSACGDDAQLCKLINRSSGPTLDCGPPPAEPRPPASCAHLDVYPDFYHWVGIFSGVMLWPAGLSADTDGFAH